MEKDKLNKELLKCYLVSGFSILILGERGTGKSRLVDEASGDLGKVVQASCASFADDSMAESELFGYVEGAFTGAKKDGHKGLLMEANNGILFLDELHCLSKSVQSKLMKAIQTDDDNKYHIRKLGGTKEISIECRLIFASNHSIEELKYELLPDFFDRIAQLTITMPSLRESRDKRINAWEAIWEQMKFDEKASVPTDSDFIEWLNSLPLYGNYRDLQKIAILYHTYSEYDKELKEELNFCSELEYVQGEFDKISSPNSDINHAVDFEYIDGDTYEFMRERWLDNLQQWATNNYGTRKLAAKKLKVSEKTLNNWKNVR